MMRALRRHEALTFGLVVAAFVAGALQSPHFLDARYLLETSTLHVEAGLAALGMTLLIVGGQIDLSVGSNVALSACLVAMAMRAGWPAPAVLAAGPVAGAALGALNGLIVVKARLPSFVVTLATMALFRGAAQVLLGPSSIPISDSLTGVDRMDVAGIPVSLLGLAGVAAAAALVLHRSVFGRWVYACGANEEAAFYAGIPVARAKILVFSITGLLCGIAALHLDSRLGVSRFDHAKGLELDAITAVVLGGASIFGGKGTVLGTLLALLLLALLKTGMGLANVKAEYQLAVVGSILIASVLAGNAFQRRKEFAA